MKVLKLAARIVALISLATVFPSYFEEVPPSRGQAKGGQATGFVFQPNDGEVLLLRRPGGGQVVIKVDPVNTGSMRVAMGTQQLPVRYRIPVHRHEHQDEILFVHQGKGTGIVGDKRLPVEPGTTIYIPHGVWHGVDNTGDAPAQIIWVVAPPGLEDYFRDIGAPPGTKREQLTEKEMIELSRKHGITVKIE